MNSLRSAWTPFLAGLKILRCRRRETSKLAFPNQFARSILTIELAQNIGQVTAALMMWATYLLQSCKGQSTGAISGELRE